MMEWLSGNWLLVLVVVFVVGMTLYGHYRGFFKIALSSLALVITLVVVNATLPQVSSFIKANTSIEKMVRETMLDCIGIDDMDSELIMSPLGQSEAINELQLPSELKKLLIANNTGEVWQQLGVEYFKDYVGEYLGNIAFNVVGFVVLFIIVFVLLHILIRVLNLFSKLPVIHGLNQIVGAVLGFALGMVYVWIAGMIVNGFSGTEWGSYLMHMINKSAFLTFILRFNPISYLLRSVIYALAAAT